MDYRERYKKAGFARENIGVNRALRSQRRDEFRREMRSEHFSIKRDLQEAVQEDEPSEEVNVQDQVDERVHAAQKRMEKLLKWKEEKNRLKIIEKQRAKPVFKVGVVHHRVYSPKQTEATHDHRKLCKIKKNQLADVPRRITRATEKRLANKAAGIAEPKPVINPLKKKRGNNTKNSKEQIQLAPKDHQFKAPEGVIAIPLFGRHALTDNKKDVNAAELSILSPKKIQENSTSDVFNSMSDVFKSGELLLHSTLVSNQSDLGTNDKSSNFNLNLNVQNNLEKTTSNLTNCDSSLHTSSNSSVEAVRLKLSSDDQGMSDNIDNEPISKKINQSITNKNSKNNARKSKLNKKNDSKNSEISEEVKDSVIQDNKNVKSKLNNSKLSSSKNESNSNSRINNSFNNINLSKNLELIIPKLDDLNKSTSPLNGENSKDQRKSLNKSSNNVDSQEDTLNISSNSETSAKSIDKNENSLKDTKSSMSRKSEISEKPPAFYSPFIVTSRGKSSSRKEVRRRFSQVNNEEIPTKENIMKKLNISIEEEERTSQYYKYILDKEIERLTELCNKWNEIKENEDIPEDIHYLIQQAVGQTNLLMNKKFERFRKLVLDCETGKGEMLVTCKDLQGFWDMMYMEIKNCDDRLAKLEELKSRNWVQDEFIENPIPSKKKIIRKKIENKNNIKVAKPSSLRALILAARKNKQGAQNNENIDIIQPNLNKSLKSPKVEFKNNVKLSTPKSASKWQNLLNKVHQQSLTKKRVTTSPLVVMKVSQMCKTPEVHLDDSIVYINSDRTPAKGILKFSRDENNKNENKLVKSTNKVLFKEQEAKTDEITSDLNSSSFKLNKTVNTLIPTERKLQFDSDSDTSFDEQEIKDKSTSLDNIKNKTPVVALSPLKLTDNHIAFLKCHKNKSAASPKDHDIPNIILNNSTILSMSPLRLSENKENQEEKVLRKSSRIKKQISFQDNLNDTKSSSSNKKFLVPVTPKPKSRYSTNSCNDSGVDGSLMDDYLETTLTDNPNLNKEDSNLSVQNDNYKRTNKGKKILATPKLKRSNSEKSNSSKKKQRPSNVSDNQNLRVTPKNRKSISMETDSIQEISNDKKMSTLRRTPRVTRSSKLYDSFSKSSPEFEKTKKHFNSSIAVGDNNISKNLDL